MSDAIAPSLECVTALFDGSTHGLKIPDLLVSLDATVVSCFIVYNTAFHNSICE